MRRIYKEVWAELDRLREAEPESLQELMTLFDGTFKLLLELREDLQGKAKGLTAWRAEELGLPAQFICKDDGKKPLCGKCKAAIEESARICPYCETKLSATAVKVNDMKELEVVQEEVREMSQPDLFVIQPMTKQDLIPGPKGLKEAKKKKRRERELIRNVTPMTSRLMGWIRLQKVADGFPYKLEFLHNLKRKHLLDLCYAMGSPRAEYLHRTNPELVQYIERHQPKGPIDVRLPRYLENYRGKIQPFDGMDLGEES